MGDPVVPGVLYVDDEAANRLIFERTFGKEFRVLLADSGEQALEILEREEIGLLLADQRLPGMLGTDLLATTKERHPQIVRMVLTAYSDAAIVIKALNEGLTTRYILKPWQRAALREALGWGLEVHQFQCQIHDLQLRLVESERLSTLGTLLASITHDIRNPIGYIAAYVETLRETQSALEAWIAALRRRDDLAGALALPEAEEVAQELEGLPQLIADMSHGLDVVTSMVQGIQTQVRGARAPQAPAPPGQTLEYVRLLVQGSVAHVGGQLELSVETGLPAVVLSAVQLSQVLLNLLTNAIDAIDGSPGKRVVNVRARAADGGVLIEVADTGAGMAPEVLGHAFEQFFTTKPPGRGTGLGLANCKQIVEGSGGRITLDSESGGGTTIAVWLPSAKV